MVLSLDPSPKSSLAGLDLADLGLLNREDTLIQLDFYYGLVKRQLLRFQSPTTGLFPAQSLERKIGSVRDSIYCASAVWAMHQAYKRIDDDRGKSYELGQSCVFCMRGILSCWMRQVKKLEAWKCRQSPELALHSIFSLDTGCEILGTGEYNHLQLDCVSLYLIYLVQMITSGLEIIYSYEEVCLVQNLVFYVERAYRTPDFGAWGRGTKYNDGNPEVNASSVGMAKAALEAVNGFNLYGRKSAKCSVIYADIDAHNRNRSIFETLLPRESNTKNTDISLLTTISFPAFATHDVRLYERTKRRLVRELEGQYGFKRFIGDGYLTEVEDRERRFYKMGETQDFEHIENEWPIYLVFMIIDGLFKENEEQVAKYEEKLSKLMSYDSQGDPVVPQMYVVPQTSVQTEKCAPCSQKRKASSVQKMRQLTGSCGSESRGSAAVPLPTCMIPEESEGEEEDCVDLYLSGQAVYIISGLLSTKLLHLWELDPIRRYLPCYRRPQSGSRCTSSFLAGVAASKLVVQIVLIAESTRLQAMLANYGIQTQTPTEVEPVQIWSPSELKRLLQGMGQNARLGINGRPNRPIGSLGTCKLYRVGGRTVLCYPIIFSANDFYLSQDMALLTNDIRTELQFVAQCWRLLGRPTFCVLVSEDNMRDPQFNVMLELLSEIKNGECGGVKVRQGRLQNLLSSSCIESLDFYHDDGLEFVAEPLKERNNLYAGYQSLTEVPRLPEVTETPHDFVSEFKFTPTHEIVEKLTSMRHLYGKIQLCGIILEREGANYEICGVRLEALLETLSQEAGRLRYWVALRYSSSLLRRIVDSLSPYATTIICTGKTLTVGVIGIILEEFDRPMSPKDMHAALFEKVQPYDMIASVLQQEMIVYCGKLISTHPQLFKGILVLRMGWIVRSMELYQMFTCHADDVDSLVPIENLSPSQLVVLLRQVLTSTSANDTVNLTDIQLRQLNGCLLRVPENFYPSVWHILKKCSGGITFGNDHLPQLPTIRLYDANELSFYHMVEKKFSQYNQPADRNLAIRILTILATVLKRNPEIYYKANISLEDLKGKAVDIFSRDQQEPSDQEERQQTFNRLPCSVADSYLGRAIVNTLLGGEIDHESSECHLQ